MRVDGCAIHGQDFGPESRTATTSSSRDWGDTSPVMNRSVCSICPLTPHTSAMARSLPLLFAAILVLGGCGSSDDGAQNAQGRPGQSNNSTPSVQAVQARFGALPLEERMSGTVEARNQVVIYPEITAPVETVIAQNGDRRGRGPARPPTRRSVPRTRPTG